MKIKRTLLPVVILMLFSASTVKAQAWQWAQEGVPGLKADVESGNVATNRTGNLYQTGDYSSTISFGSVTLTSQSAGDMYLVKYDKNGNVLWARTSESGIEGYASGYAVTSDDSDNSYVAGYTGGYYYGSGDTVSFGNKTLILPTQQYFFVVKYDPNGNVKWATSPDTNVILDPAIAYSITTDKSGNVYVTGSEGFIIKYDRNGNVVWTVLPGNYSGGSSFYLTNAYSVAVDNSDNVYISGQFDDYIVYGGYQLNSPGADQFVVKFDSNGNPLWARQSNNSYSYYYYYYNNGNSITVDQSGSAFLAGNFLVSITFGNYTFTTRDSTVQDFFVVKYNPDGSIAWGKQATLDIADRGWACNNICSDDSNHVYLAGGEGATATAGNAKFTFSGSTVSELDTDVYDAPAFILKLDSLGNTLCSASTIAGGFFPNGITADSTGRYVYLGGAFEETFNLGSTTLSVGSGGYNTYTGRWIPCDACNFAVTLNQPPSICSGQSDTLTASGGEDYVWSPSTGLSASTGSSVIASPTLSVTYTVTSTNDNDCLATGLDAITVTPSPNKPFAIQNKDTLISSAAHNNQWYRNDTLLKNDTSQILIISVLAQYWVTVLNVGNGCSATSDTVYVTSLTGIEQLSANNNQLSIYPNPVSESLTLKSEQPVNEIDVANDIGQIVLQIPFKGFENEVDLSRFSNGIYFIMVTTNEGRTVVPVMKE